MVEGVLYPQQGQLVALEGLHRGQPALGVGQGPGAARPTKTEIKLHKNFNKLKLIFSGKVIICIRLRSHST